jgi:hypothetical protein
MEIFNKEASQLSNDEAEDIKLILYAAFNFQSVCLFLQAISLSMYLSWK